jgi:DNA-directed RNA polymerase subunit F
MKTTVVSEEPISMYDLKKTLEVIKARDKELGFRAAKTEEYLKSFARLDDKKVAELKKKLEDLSIPRLKAEHINKLVDILPGDVEDVRLVLNSYSITVTNENLAKIADVIKDYRK